jgi:hypothetical protein
MDNYYDGIFWTFNRRTSRRQARPAAKPRFCHNYNLELVSHFLPSNTNLSLAPTPQPTTQPSSCLATTVDLLLLPGALPPHLPVLRPQLPSKQDRHRPLRCHLKTALPHHLPPLPQLLSNLLVRVFSVKWLALLRKSSPVHFGCLRGDDPSCADVCMTVVSPSVPLLATQSVASSVAVLQLPPSSQLRPSPILPTTAPTLHPVTRLLELVRLMSQISVAAWTRTRAV